MDLKFTKKHLDRTMSPRGRGAFLPAGRLGRVTRAAAGARVPPPARAPYMRQRVSRETLDAKHLYNIDLYKLMRMLYA